MTKVPKWLGNWENGGGLCKTRKVRKNKIVWKTHVQVGACCLWKVYRKLKCCAAHSYSRNSSWQLSVRPNQRWRSTSQCQMKAEARGADTISQRNSEGRDIKATFSGASIFKWKGPKSQLLLHLSPTQPGPQSTVSLCSKLFYSL